MKKLALHPIHLTRPERVKAHVSICILAYLLLNTIEFMLQQAGCSTSPEQVLKQMESCQLNVVGFKDSPNHSITITKMTEQQEQWMRLLQCEHYLKPKVINRLTKALKLLTVGTKLAFAHSLKPCYD